MELIPILSTIILVATISTFILAVGAYILYKIRESKSPPSFTEKKVQSAEFVQPVVVPADSVSKEADTTERGYKHRTGDVNISVNHIPYTKPERVGGDNIEKSGRVVVPADKYSKYSQEGYIPSNEETSEKVLKWR